MLNILQNKYLLFSYLKPNNLIVSSCFELIFTWFTFTFHCFVILLTIEKVQNYENVQDTESNKLR